MLFKNLLATVLLFAGLSAQAQSQNQSQAQLRAPEQSNQQNLFISLPGTAWEGTFNFHGESGGIRVAFLPETNAKGEIQYLSRAKFGGFICPARLLLSEVDQPCEFTPRGFALQGSNSGEIRVYSCAKSSQEEASLASSANRSPLFSLTVADTEIVDGGQTLLITAVAGPMSLIKITYELHAVAFPSDLHAWIDQLK